MRLCEHPGCSKQHRAKGWCFMHWQRNKKGLPMDAPAKQRSPRGTNQGKACSIATCGRRAAHAGLCQAHGLRRKTEPGAWSGPILPLRPAPDAGARLTDFWAPTAHVLALEEEVTERGGVGRYRVRKTDLLREALAEWVERRAERKRQEALAADAKRKWRRGA